MSVQLAFLLYLMSSTCVDIRNPLKLLADMFQDFDKVRVALVALLDKDVNPGNALRASFGRQ
jgi:hypothetical protein